MLWCVMIIDYWNFGFLEIKVAHEFVSVGLYQLVPTVCPPGRVPALISNSNGMSKTEK